jgi:streptomycin 6-kinase
LAKLPALTGEFMDRWQLQADGPVMHGVCALVLPVRRSDGTSAMLKLTWPHEEARYEHLALAAWNGAGAVHVLEADAFVMLLERLHADRDLSAVPLDDALACIGDLLRRLNALRADGPFTRLADLIAEWSAEFAAALREQPHGVSRPVLDCAAGC